MNHLRPPPLVGRRAEIDELSDLAGRLPLVTLVGPPGAGKTLLARQVAARAPAACFVDLTEARDERETCDVVRAALRVDLDEEPIASIGRALAARGALLVVLDNFEHLVDRAHHLLPCWLEAAPALRLLVTSRERLAIAGERLYPLAPLCEDDALALFHERARDARPGYRADDAVLRAIVRRLDGLPLAIELAAARMAIYGPREIERRLDDPFSLLGGARRDVPERHATLHAAIDWSWRLLRPAEQAMLAQCSVFRGGFTLAAAEAIVHPGPGTPPVRELLSSLLRRSLVAHMPVAGDEPRFHLYLSVRDFAAARLAPDVARDAVERHAAYYVQAVPSPEAWSEDEPARLRWLEAERDNLLAAAARASPGPALRAGLALDPLFETCGPHAARLSLLDPLLARARDAGVDPRLLLAGMLARVRALRCLGRLDEAEAVALASVAASAALDDERLAARARMLLAIVQHLQGRSEAAIASHAAALPGLAEADAGPALTAQAAILVEAGHLAEAAPLLDRAERSALAAGALRTQALIAFNRGLLLTEIGDGARAAREYARGLSLGAGDLRVEAFLLCGLGMLAFDRETPDAATHLAAAAAKARETGDARAHLSFGALALAVAGDLDALDAEMPSLYASAPPPAVRAVVLVRGVQAVRLAALAGDLPGAARAAAGLLDEEPGEERSWDVRWARRIVARVLGGEPAIEVAPDGAAFRLGDRRVPLARRAPLRRIFARLVLARLAAPGRPVEAEALVSAGWPGETMQPPSAANRLHVALSSLRSHGLRDVLLHAPGGHLLASTAGVRFLAL